MRSNIFDNAKRFLLLSLCFLNLSHSASAQGIHYEVTETSTSGRVTGWEHELTDRDPNLANWHWEPMGVHGHQTNVKRWVDSSGKPHFDIVRTPYVKPIQLPLPQVSHNLNRGLNTKGNLSGRLLKRTKAPLLVAQSKMPDGYLEQYAKSGNGANLSGPNVKTQLVGSIVHMAPKRIMN